MLFGSFKLQLQLKQITIELKTEKVTKARRKHSDLIALIEKFFAESEVESTETEIFEKKTRKLIFCQCC